MRLLCIIITTQLTSTMKTTNETRRQVMTAAWAIYKRGVVRFFSTALKMGWEKVKETAAAAVKPAANLIDEVKRGLLRNIGFYTDTHKHNALQLVALVKGGFAGDVANSVVTYRKISEKQAYVIARALVEQCHVTAANVANTFVK